MNIITKDCLNPVCQSHQLDIEGAIIINKKSFNLYKCPRCHQVFTIKRTTSEQKLTQKFIDASKIKLNNPEN
jgi:transposase-like protein